MMIVSKDCEVDFVVTAGDPPREVATDWRALLTDDQLDILAGNPELIAWFARELRARAEEQGHGEVVVRANAYCALNGRAFQPLVDPAVDLSRAEGWGWITPLEGGDAP
jgi:hypothetical protein